MNGLYQICPRCGFHQVYHAYPNYECPTCKGQWTEYFKQQEDKRSWDINSLLPKSWLGFITTLVVFISMMIYLFTRG
jgi:uncharacterized protein (DUF983 family)